MRRVRSLTLAVSALALAYLPSAPVWACTVCFGDPSSSETRGLRGAILFLLVLVGLVQVGFVKLFWTFRRRAKSIDERKKRFQVVRGGVRT
jgi:hypothetical protein